MEVKETTNTTGGSVISAIDALEEAIRRMEERKENYEDKYESSKKSVFLNYANIVSEDIDIIKDLEKEYGLLGNTDKEDVLETDR